MAKKKTSAEKLHDQAVKASKPKLTREQQIEKLSKLSEEDIEEIMADAPPEITQRPTTESTAQRDDDPTFPRSPEDMPDRPRGADELAWDAPLPPVPPIQEPVSGDVEGVRTQDSNVQVREADLSSVVPTSAGKSDDMLRDILEELRELPRNIVTELREG